MAPPLLNICCSKICSITLCRALFPWLFSSLFCILQMNIALVHGKSTSLDLADLHGALRVMTQIFCLLACLLASAAHRVGLQGKFFGDFIHTPKALMVHPLLNMRRTERRSITLCRALFPWFFSVARVLSYTFEMGISRPNSLEKGEVSQVNLCSFTDMLHRSVVTPLSHVALHWATKPQTKSSCVLCIPHVRQEGDASDPT